MLMRLRKIIRRLQQGSTGYKLGFSAQTVKNRAHTDNERGCWGENQFSGSIFIK